MSAVAITLDARPIHALQATPELVQYSQLLAMDSTELEARVAAELADNPALIAPETWSCRRCGAERLAERCVTCEVDAVSVRGVTASEPAVGERTDASPREPVERARPADRLIALARLLLPEPERPLVNALVAALDDDGYLRQDLAELAAELGVDPTRLEHVRYAIRHAGGPAVAARDCRESLLLQLAALDPTPLRALAAAIVSDHLETLAAGRLAAIATKLAVSVAEVAAARDEIHDRLEPRPRAGLHQAADAERARIWPDLVIRPSSASGARFAVEAVERPGATARLDEAHGLVAAGVIGDDRAADRRDALDRVRRAREFLGRLRDRRRCLERIGELVAERQWAFVLYGPAFIQPLTRAEIAAEAGLHESTISRAIANKFVLLPSGRLVSFSVFFDASLAIQDVLRRVLAEEDRPMSDADLAAGLRARGYRLARRTVAKYRLRLGVPAVAARRTAESRFA